METKIIKIHRDAEGVSDASEYALRSAGEVLRAGGLVAFPTETVYGLGGDALNPESSRRIYAAKGRPSDNPLIVHICDFRDIYAITAEVIEEAEKLAKAFWPGPLTMILRKSDKVPYETTGGLDTVAVRMPSDPVARKLIAYGGGYVAAPSANTSGKPSPTMAKYVIEDMMGRIDIILDGGEGEIGLESTIVDLTVSPPQILRPGYITAEMLADALEDRVETDAAILEDGDKDSGENIEDGINIVDENTVDKVKEGKKKKAPRAPGMKYKHYAPKGELTIVEGLPEQVAAYINSHAAEDMAKGGKVGIIGTEERIAGYRGSLVKCLGSRQDKDGIARHLYTVLREMDDENVTRIYSEGFETEGFGEAIMNRLLKAAGHRVVRL